MATNGDSVSTGTTFSHLFDNNTSHAASMGFESFGFSPSFSNGTNSPMMLCFGGENQKSQVCVGVGVVESSSPSSSNNSCSSNYLSKSKKPHCRETKKAEGNKESGPGSGNRGGQSRKRSKTEKNPSSMGSIKGRKEKLGERVTALQQLVSPFGKTDTASVLHEAMGYIRFLHDQVQVLSSPYLQQMPPLEQIREGNEEGRRCDLKSRGLCLVPLACTLHVTESNGADFWSPVMGNKSSMH